MPGIAVPDEHDQADEQRYQQGKVRRALENYILGGALWLAVCAPGIAIDDNCHKAPKVPTRPPIILLWPGGSVIV